MKKGAHFIVKDKGQIQLEGALRFATANDQTGGASTIEVQQGGKVRKIKGNAPANLKAEFGKDITLDLHEPGSIVQPEDGELNILGRTRFRSAPKKQSKLEFQGPGDWATTVFQASSGSSWLGSATISGNPIVNSGNILPGNSAGPGYFLFDTDLALTSSSVVGLDITGSLASDGFDEVKVTGFAALDGTLIVQLTGYTPSLSDTYTILDLPGGYTGTFDTVNFPTFNVSGTNYTFKLNYNPYDVTLSVVQVPASAPTISGLSSSSGSTAGGQSVTVTGTNFSAVQSITFNGVPVLDYVVNSSTSISVHTPANPAGAVTVTVTTAASFASTSYTYTTGSVPSVSSLGDSSGYTIGGDTITINGSNFTGATGVKFGSVDSPYFRVLSATQISAVVPEIDAPDTVHVTVTAYSGTSSTSANDEFTYSDQPEPTLSSLSASSGSSAGGEEITLTGTYFENVYGVFVGGSPAEFTVDSPTAIEVTMPPGLAGSVEVSVLTAGGSSELSSNSRYTYEAEPAPVVTSLSASSGSGEGGTVVTINGTWLSATQAVYFGDVPAQFFQASDTQLIAVAPPHAGGSVHVRVHTFSGSSAQSSADLFTYSAPSAPTVSALDVSSGSTAGGTVVVVTGTNLTSATSVTFGDVEAGFSVLSSTKLIAYAPSQADATVHVRVTTYGGISSTSANDEFDYNAASAPSVSAITPDGGTSTSGAAVTILGANFTSATSVKFGSLEAYFSVLSDDTIVAYAPFYEAGSGTVHVTVTTHGGTSSTSSADEFDYTAATAPTVSSLSTSSGGSNGGTLVTITGTGFSDAYAVYFGDVPSPDWVVNSSTQITALAPGHTAGTIDVRVGNGAGLSAASSSSRFSYSLDSLAAITSLATSSGSTAGGTEVVITGTGFTSATAVTFGDTYADFTVDSSTQITAVAPPQSSGTIHIRVHNHSGSSAPVSDDLFSYNAASAPTVSALATTTGSTAGDTLVHLTGTNFTSATSVLFGDEEAYFVVNSATSITAWSPAQSAGTIHVRVTTGGGTSSTSANDEFTYVAASAPSVSGLSPSTGSTLGDTAVLIHGSNFSAATAVKFGTTDALSFTVLSDNAILAYSPLLAAGTVDVRVTTAGGTSSVLSADEFTYTNVSASAPAVTEVGPDTGSTAGGRVVVITGTNFAGATAVKFGANDATSFSIDSDTQITAVAPAGSAATVDVRVTTNNGTSSVVSADEFTYLSAAVPAVSSLGTSSGSAAGGTSVVITGTNFTSATEVYFGGVEAASFVVNSSTQITATTSASVPGTVHVTVTTPSGTSATSANDEYDFTAASAPAISSLGTSSGTTAGGTSVVITGTNLGGAVEVYFGDVPAASFVIDSGTQITAVTPASVAGTVDVVVVTTSGVSSPAAAARYSFSAASVPTVSSLGTSSGSTAGGTTVVITGTNFTSATAVRFGEVEAEFTVNSSTQITATTPAAYAGAVAVTVWTSVGSSQVSGSSVYTYNAASSPTVSSLGTSSGSTAGGTTVVITGTNFTSATEVHFGDEPASFTVDSSTQITAYSPLQSASTVHVTVTTHAGTSATSGNDEFDYNAASAPTVTDLTITSGSAAGGTSVTILGTNFTSATAVLFGTEETYFDVLSPTAIVAYAPAGSGTVHVTVTTGGGTSSTSSADEFTYSSVTAPTISSLSAESGTTAGGETITLTGTGLLDATSLTFGGRPVDFDVLSSTTIRITTPPSAAGTVDVVVSVPGAESTPARFSFIAASAPTVTALSADTGSTIGGTIVTITGTDFTGASAVLFGGYPAQFEVVSSTSIVAIAPPASEAGTIDVVVFTPTGSSEVNSDDEFSYTVAATPTLSAISPSSGSTIGGAVVNLTGSGFLGATSVKFGSHEAQSEKAIKIGEMSGHDSRGAIISTSQHSFTFGSLDPRPTSSPALRCGFGIELGCAA